MCLNNSRNDTGARACGTFEPNKFSDLYMMSLSGNLCIKPKCAICSSCYMLYEKCQNVPRKRYHWMTY